MARASESGARVWPLRVLIVAGAVLLTTAASSHPPYRRAEWPHWIDADGDCQNTATEAMIDQSVFEATLSEDGCSVTQGLWNDEWSGDTLQHETEVSVQHLVPLANAHASGGAAWDTAKRTDFANEVGQLRVVGTDVAQQRADRAPEAWQPPLESGRCGYARSWAAIKKTWDLSVTQAELDALKGMLETC